MCWFISENAEKIRTEGVQNPGTTLLQSTVWIYDNEPNTIKVFRLRSSSNKMISCFFVCYTTICLPTVYDVVRKDNKTLHHPSSWQCHKANNWIFEGAKHFDFFLSNKNHLKNLLKIFKTITLQYQPQSGKNVSRISLSVWKIV